MNSKKSIIKQHRQSGYVTSAFKDLGINKLIQDSNVFKSDRSILGKFLAGYLKNNKFHYESRAVLDLGCGCGLLGIICALNGASEVYFSDINHDAVKNTQDNLKSLHISKSKVYEGYLFEPLGAVKFDVIIFNSPTFSGKASNAIEQSLICEDSILDIFFSTARGHLKENGVILMPHIVSHKRSPVDFASRSGWQIETVDSEANSLVGDLKIYQLS